MSLTVRLEKFVMICALLCGLGGWSLFSPAAAAPSKKAEQEEANSAFQAQDWKAAAKAYRKITRSDPENGQAWLRLGASQHQLERFEEAVEAYLKADEIGFAPARVRFNLGCTYARLGKKDESLKWLHKAIDAGYTLEKSYQEDEDLESLRSDERFAKVLSHVAREAHPCQHGDQYREFDFWLGEWEVTVPSGQVAGHNRIVSAADGCLLQENWESVSGGAGKSMNYYDSVSQSWKQLWVAAGGNSIAYEGHFTDGAMRFEGEHYYRDGHTELSRMSFTPQEDGTVRQFIEQSKDDGKTWYVWFDGTYTRKK